MKTVILLAALLLAFGDTVAFAAQPQPAGPQLTVQKKQSKVKKGKKAKKKGISPQEGRKLQKKAEQDAKKHALEARKQEFRMMQEAQRRAIMQQSQGQQPQAGGAPQQ